MTRLEMGLGPYRSACEGALEELVAHKVIARIWDMDHTVWKMNPKEITDRLGWLRCPEVMRPHTASLRSMADEARSAGYNQALLLGMGGSSLAPEVLRRTFGVQDGFLDLAVLDSTDPAAVAAHARRLDAAKTLFLVSTKSGTTTETLSFFSYFYSLLCSALGRERAGEHFIAITDPGNPLNDTASRLGFRKVIAGDPTIGGRFSALSVFGLVPASLMGMDVQTLLERATSVADTCRINTEASRDSNDGARLGAALGSLARSGRDKLTFFISEKIAGFGDWVEQLIAESTGKEGKGILPVIAEEPDSPELYGNDRVFVSLRVQGDVTNEPELGRLVNLGHPVIRIFMDDPYDIGGQFFLWEFATAVAGHCLGINPFDQPDVESTKKYTRAAIEEYRQKGSLKQTDPVLVEHGIQVFAPLAASSLREALKTFLADAREGSYVSLQAYLQPTEQTGIALKKLRLSLMDAYHIPSTLGYGPRFLHSTGQLHKGDAGSGLFIQITSKDSEAIPIPDGPGSEESSMTFGILKAAQAQGDLDALSAAHRRTLRLHILDADIVSAVERIAQAVA